MVNSSGCDARAAGNRAAERGLVLVYTGDGKGKTTAALGLALRAIGHGSKVYMLQFMKGPGNVYGEYLAAHKHLPDLTVVRSGREDFVDKSRPLDEDIALAAEGMRLAREAVSSGAYGLVILDEINVAVDYGLVKVPDVIDLVRSRPDGVDLVLTGRYAAPEIVEAADLVSEVREIKHHYRKGVAAREGIEF